MGPGEMTLDVRLVLARSDNCGFQMGTYNLLVHD